MTQARKKTEPSQTYIVCGLALCLACAWSALAFYHRDARVSDRAAKAVHIPAGPDQNLVVGHAPDLPAMLKLAPHELAATPITQMNLLCTSELSPYRISIKESGAQIASWAEHVRSETERHLYRFRNNPAEFENSEGFFRMLMLAVVLAEDFHIQYDPNRISTPGTGSSNDGFFADPNPVFLTGLLGPNRLGTCSSMPVLYVAIGRQLGYPLYLVTTKGHLFVRWEGKGERFNIEATSHGLNRFSDDYYRHWPFEITSEEEQAEGYLKSLSPPEELAAFLSIRGMCLHERGRIREAAESFSHAAQLAPGVRSYRFMLANLQKQIALDISTTNHLEL